MIKSFVTKREMKHAGFAKLLGKSRQNVYDLYERDDVYVKELLTICRTLGHNFFSDIYPDKNPEIDKVFDALKEVVKNQLKQ
jgi:DNA-binding XRE family transcriptional regulator